MAIFGASSPQNAQGYMLPAPEERYLFPDSGGHPCRPARSPLLILFFFDKQPKRGMLNILKQNSIFPG
jgi:hypothetical protein